MKPVPINYFILVPFIIALLAFIIFFSRSLIFTGLRRLKRFTALMLGAFVALLVLYFIKYISETRLIPTGLIDIGYNATHRFIKLICLAAFVVIAFFKVSKEKSSRWLTGVWVVIIMLNVAEICYQGYMYVTAVEPLLAFNAKKNTDIILEHTAQPHNYLYYMIYPFCWVVISGLSLAKIRKEKRKLLLHTYPSYSKIVSL